MEPADHDRAAGVARPTETQTQRKSIREADQNLGAVDEARREPRGQRPHAERGECRKSTLDRVGDRSERAGHRARARYHRGGKSRSLEVEKAVEEFARRLEPARKALQPKVAPTLVENDDRGILGADSRGGIHCRQAAFSPKLARYQPSIRRMPCSRPTLERNPG